MDWLDLLAVQGTLRSLLQYHSSKSPILRRSSFFRTDCMRVQISTKGWGLATVENIQKTISWTNEFTIGFERICLQCRDPGSILGQEDPLEKGMANYSSILAWGIPWRKEPGGLQFMGSQRVGDDWVTNTTTLVENPKTEMSRTQRTHRWLTQTLLAVSENSEGIGEGPGDQSWVNSVQYHLCFFRVYRNVIVFCACMLSCFNPVWLFGTLWNVAH